MRINLILAELFSRSLSLSHYSYHPNPLSSELDMLLIFYYNLSVKLLSNVKDIFALTPPQQSETLNDQRFNGLHYLIHFIAAKNLQLIC